jgi:hypothetical protein
MPIARVVWQSLIEMSPELKEALPRIGNLNRFLTS